MINVIKNFITSYNNFNKSNKSKGDFCRKCSSKVYNSGVLNKNFGKTTTYGFKKGVENYSSINFKGINNPNYNINLSDEERINNRDTIENLNWRKLIYERDNYKCIICGTKKNGLAAHHLDGYSEFKDKRYNLNNGVTLCTDHHKDYHKQFKYKNSTREKFNNYIFNLFEI